MYNIDSPSYIEPLLEFAERFHDPIPKEYAYEIINEMYNFSDSDIDKEEIEDLLSEAEYMSLDKQYFAPCDYGCKKPILSEEGYYRYQKLLELVLLAKMHDFPYALDYNEHMLTIDDYILFIEHYYLGLFPDTNMGDNLIEEFEIAHNYNISIFTRQFADELNKFFNRPDCCIIWKHAWVTTVVSIDESRNFIESDAFEYSVYTLPCNSITNDEITKQLEELKHILEKHLDMPIRKYVATDIREQEEILTWLKEHMTE